MSTEFPIELSNTTRIEVRYGLAGTDVRRYAVVLIAEIDGAEHTSRLYDNSHGRNEMHRYTRRGGKQAAADLGDGDAGRAMREAIYAIRSGWEGMIFGWARR